MAFDVSESTSALLPRMLMLYIINTCSLLFAEVVFVTGEVAYVCYKTPETLVFMDLPTM